MRFLQVIPSIDPMFGGPPVVALALHSELAELGVSVDLVTIGYQDEGARPAPRRDGAPPLPEAEGITILDPAQPYAVENARGLVKVLRAKIKDADFVLVHSQFRLPQLVTFWLCVIYRTRYGVMLHGTLEPIQQKNSPLAKRVYDLASARQLLNRADYVLVTADSEGANAVASGRVRADKIVVAPLGAGLTPPVDDHPLARRLAGELRGRVYCFVGRLAAKKRPDLLVRAWAESKLALENTLVIAGPDGDHTAAELDALAERLDVAGSVHCVGAVDTTAKSWLLHRSDVFVLPSVNENFAVAVVEALVGGCAVITTDQVETGAYVVAAGAGWRVAADDERALVGALEESAAADGEVIAAMGARGREYAGDHLTWAHFARRVLDVSQSPAPSAGPTSGGRR